MKRLVLMITLCFLSVVISPSTAQEKEKKDAKPPKNWGFNIPKGTSVTLKLTPSFMLERSIEVTSQPNGLAVNGSTEWRLLGFPSLYEYRIEGIRLERPERSANKNERQLSIHLESKGDYSWVSLNFREGIGDVNAAFRELSIIGGAKEPEAQSYLNRFYEEYAEQRFKGQLANFQMEKRTEIVRLLHKMSSESQIKTETYKGNAYIAVDLGTYDSIFNTLRMPEASRLARVINERLLGYLKQLQAAIEKNASFYGIKLDLRIPHKSFADDYARPDYDKLQLYVQSALINQFAQAEITSQQLIDSSVVIVNENRVQVPLAEKN